LRNIIRNCLTKKEIILITKKDLVTEEEASQRIKLFKDQSVMAVSIYDNVSLQALAEICLKKLIK